MKLNDYKLWTALITPLTPGLKVDYASFENVLNEQDNASNGLLVLGSTGEALNLSLGDKKDIVEFVISLKLKSPLMIGIGGHELHTQIEWIKWLETKKIDAYLMVTPIYAKPGTQGQIKWFEALMDQSTKPVMLYNVPSRAGAPLSVEAVQTLKRHPNFWAIKEASGSVVKFTEYLKAAGGAPVYCGDDALMNDFARAGGAGLVSVASNTWPLETNLYTKCCLENKLDEKALWSDACNSLFSASNPIPAKALLHAEGRISHPTMMPPLCETDLKNKAKILNYSSEIKKWYKSKV